MPTTASPACKAIEQNLYRIAQEALANVLKHANASRLLVSLQRVADKTRLVVQDNGIGFDPTVVHRNGHFGLTGIEERAAMIGGTVTVKSQLGSGTTENPLLPKSVVVLWTRVKQG